MVLFMAGRNAAVRSDPKGGGQIEQPIGAGDTCSAVFFSEYISGTAPEEAFACGLCAATASCMTDTPAMYDKNTALSLRKEIEF